LVVGFALMASLVIALAILASPIFAAAAFVVAFAAFLLWRGTRRAEGTRGVREGTQVPSTEEASADPVEDSGVAEVKPDRRA
jgi:hypothetical protein